MLLAVFSVIAFLGFLVLLKINHEKKIDILVGLVIVMVLANYFNEISNSLKSISRHDDTPEPRHLDFSASLYKLYSDKYFILPEEYKVEEYLRNKVRNNENVIVHFQNLNFERFRLIFHNLQKEHKNVLATEISGSNTIPFDFYGLKRQLNSNSYYYCLIVENFNRFDQMSIIKNLYLRNKVTIIFKKVPNNFTYHSINDLTEKIPINQNYFYTQLTKSYTPQLISKCQRFTNIDYDFYLKSQNTPLVDLCCHDLPHTAVTDCIRQKMSDENQYVNIEEVKHCFKNNRDDMRGVIFQNGMVKAAKEYYWAGKCDSKVFSNNPSQQL